MIGILYFYLPGCKYCKRADILLLELQNNNAAYADVQILKIDEQARPEIAAKFTHSRVPAFFLGDNKLYEADPNETREQMKENLENVLKATIEVNKAVAGML